jgi:hypothetical protein
MAIVLSTVLPNTLLMGQLNMCSTIQQELAYRMYLIHDLPSLHAHINAIVATLHDFHPYFLNCGY